MHYRVGGYMNVARKKGICRTSCYLVAAFSSGVSSMSTTATHTGVRVDTAMMKPTLRGVVFDMDGTLTVPNLGFEEMYRRCGVPLDQDILQAVQEMDEADAARAHRVIEEMEHEGRQTLQLMPGAAELGQWLTHHQLPMALVTRNTNRTVEAFCSQLWPPHMPFSLTISRDGGHTAKPDPAALHHIAKHWSIDLPTKSLLMVGDSPSNDVVFGKAAGVSTVLLNTGSKYSDSRPSIEQADMNIPYLWELPRILCRQFIVDGPLGTNQPLIKYPPPPPPTTKACQAARNGSVEIIQECSPQMLNEPDESGNTPLIWAADANQMKVVEALLSIQDIDVDIQGYLGATALCRASRRGHAEILQLLLQKGKSNPDISNIKMQYPLHFAAFKKHPQTVHILLENGANPLVLDRKGRTPDQDTSDPKIRDMIIQFRNNKFNLTT
uniref:Phosphoglycolate phosphatase n=1 Tax=Attheya septentrionalis TaxID=420275 RepID=A0A7S2XQY9_9STRA|mmetsp:Transcript_28024/g.51042  ORF Transcript_28024/g.51042 Transcript_28024/m.51042 type:complete len:438 (+) Transcript_28024:141-1454(+)